MYSIVILSALSVLSPAAPIPFPKQVKPIPARLTPVMLYGSWKVQWGDIVCQMKFQGEGFYRCQWGTIVYRGEWGIASDGLLWITESSTPGAVRSWQSYAIRLNPATLTGKIEVGAPGLSFRLEKIRGQMRRK